MQRPLLIHARNQSMRLGNCVIFIASSCSDSRVFSAREAQWPANTKTSTPSFMKLATEFSYRFWQVLQYPPISSRDTTNPKAAVALDLPLELFAEKNLAHAPLGVRLRRRRKPHLGLRFLGEALHLVPPELRWGR
jgi:hypothetical protein